MASGLKSIRDIVNIYYKSCETCGEFGDKDSRYNALRVIDDVAMLYCPKCKDFKIGKIEFTVSKGEILELTPRMNELIKSLSGNISNLPCEDRQVYFNQARNLFDELELYASFAPKNLSVKVQGSCIGCLKTVPLIVEESLAFVDCGYCRQNCPREQ